MVEIADGVERDSDTIKAKEDLKILEAVLFVSGRFLNMRELVSLSDLNPSTIRELIEKLKKKYEGSDSVMRVIHKGGEIGEMWKMDILQEYAYLVNRLASGSSEFSEAEKETLAILAYKQLIKQSVIIKIRGNKAYDHIKKFAELGLIKKKKSGRTWELSLSDEFYDYFNISEKKVTEK